MKSAGSVAGLVTALFVIWDRFFRSTPSAFIMAQPILPGSVVKAAYLRVINRSERPLIISWPTGTSWNNLRLSASHSTAHIIASLKEGATSAVVDGGADAYLVVLKPGNFENLELDQSMEVEVLWRFAQPVVWQRDRKLRIRISKCSYLLLIGEEDQHTADTGDVS